MSVCMSMGMSVGSPVAHAEPHLSQADAALIGEMFHLRDTLGDHLWTDWAGHAAPVLYKTRTEDVLLDHPVPPDDFHRAYDDALADSVWVRAQTDSTRYGAAFPFAGRWTVVVSRPDPGDDPCLWTLTAAHELFHVHQNRMRATRIVNPFVGPHAGEHELSYPFPHDAPAVNALFALEGELVFRALEADPADTLLLARTRAALGHTHTLAATAFTDSLDFMFKQWMEWNEGVARYTERELSRLAAEGGYVPSDGFTRAFPDARYATAWTEKWSGALAPVRFVGEGVGGRAKFYYLGMGKAYLLDRLSPGWRMRHFERPLHAAIAGG